MKVDSITGNNVLIQKMSFPQRRVFKGTPQKMVMSYDNIKNYYSLSNGSYLDIHDDLFAPQNKEIRKYNLSFLDTIDTPQGKKQFIEHFKSVTKFPNLAAVSENIENEFINTIKSVSKGFNDYKYDIIAAGYDGTCSVGKRMALPGSDLDKAFVLLRGDIYKFNYAGMDEEIVNNFKSRLWNCTDQRILSYNHDTSFPTVMTIGQVKDLIRKLDNITRNMNFAPEEMKFNLENEYIDLIKASKFNILLSEKLPKRMYDDDVFALNKEVVKNFAYFIESLRDGKKVITGDSMERLLSDVTTSDFYKYSNVAQMVAMKNAVASGREQKKKILLRKTIKEDFESWPIDKQFDFVKTLIKYSCEDQTEFMEYFNNDRNVKDSYKPLLGILCYGDASRRINPDFEIKNDFVNIYLSKNEPVTLYRGYEPNVLWINSVIKEDIEDVLLHIEKIKKINLFKDIDRVQAQKPLSGLPARFYEIMYRTSDGGKIIERMLR